MDAFEVTNRQANCTTGYWRSTRASFLGINLDSAALRVGVVMEDSSPEAFSFLDALRTSTSLRVKTTRDREKMEADLVAGRIKGLFQFPAYEDNLPVREKEP